MIKGIAFDLEGTVVDLERFHHNAHLEVFRRVGLNLSLEEAMRKIECFVGGPDKAIMKEVYELGYKNMSVEEMLKLDERLYEEQLKGEEIFPRSGFLEFIQKIKGLGILYSIGSLDEFKRADVILKKSKLYNSFPKEMIVLAEHVQNLKPSPEVYLETAKRMGIKPEEQLVFEDSYNGVRAAVSAGSKSIGMPVFNTAFIINRLKEAGAYKIFSGWKELNLTQLIKEEE